MREIKCQILSVKLLFAPLTAGLIVLAIGFMGMTGCSGTSGDTNFENMKMRVDGAKDAEKQKLESEATAAADWQALSFSPSETNQEFTLDQELSTSQNKPNQNLNKQKLENLAQKTELNCPEGKCPVGMALAIKIMPAKAVGTAAADDTAASDKATTAPQKEKLQFCTAMVNGESHVITDKSCALDDLETACDEQIIFKYIDSKQEPAIAHCKDFTSKDDKKIKLSVFSLSEPLKASADSLEVSRKFIASDEKLKLRAFEMTHDTSKQSKFVAKLKEQLCLPAFSSLVAPNYVHTAQVDAAFAGLSCSFADQTVGGVISLNDQPNQIIGFLGEVRDFDPDKIKAQGFENIDLPLQIPLRGTHFACLEQESFTELASSPLKECSTSLDKEISEAIKQNKFTSEKQRSLLIEKELELYNSNYLSTASVRNFKFEAKVYYEIKQVALHPQVACVKRLTGATKIPADSYFYDEKWSLSAQLVPTLTFSSPVSTQALYSATVDQSTGLFQITSEVTGEMPKSFSEYLSSSKVNDVPSCSDSDKN